MSQIWQDEAREKWVHRLGNLVLLSRRKNAQAKNYDFDEKKDKYFDKGNPTIFPITLNVIRQTEEKTEQTKWNQQIVEYNQQEYLQVLLNLWNLEKSIIETTPIDESNTQDFYVNFNENTGRN